MSLPPLEISDVITPRPVRRSDAVARLQASGQVRAARLVERMPATDDVLDEAHVVALMRRVHAELQRLGEELQLPQRVSEDLDRLRQAMGNPLRRVVDLGCGSGYVLRWLSHDPSLAGVDLVGVDHDPGLMEWAARLGRADGCRARFVVGDALAPGVAVAEPEATIVISSGVLHHIPAADLPAFFAAHATGGVAAFAHYDPEPGWLTNLGSWVFHRARMREAVSRHDGNLSMRRAHPADVLLDAVAEGAPGYAAGCVGGQSVLRVLRPVTGTKGA
ncbi:class I SAM-dependent methyltransferase [Janibacter limosus]|uniref:class I SAM-dependent methyltransferase n=1 Tax=Janibacter limosus TaxID=53458 RepID=UPI000834EA32|nr:methyltransferase domain-containing protein [Janibacter limosus]